MKNPGLNLPMYSHLLLVYHLSTVIFRLLCSLQVVEVGVNPTPLLSLSCTPTPPPPPPPPQPPTNHPCSCTPPASALMISSSTGPTTRTRPWGRSLASTSRPTTPTPATLRRKGILSTESCMRWKSSTLELSIPIT